MKAVAFLAVLLLLAGSATAQRRASPSPAPASPSPAPAATNATADATDATVEATPDTNTTATATDDTTAAADNATAAAPAGGSKATIPDKRIKAFYDSPKAAAERIPQLAELNKLVAASPAVTKLLQDKSLVATIFAPNNDAVKAALKYVDSNFPNMTTKELGEMGIIDSLLQYHVTAGNAALTSDRLRNGQKLTMLNQEPTTIIKKAAAAADTGARRLLQAGDSLFIRSNTNQTVPIMDANYQGGKAIIHIIDGVLIPASLAANYSMADIPGASNETIEEPAAAGNDTDADATGAGNATRGGADATGAPAPSPKPAPKSSAGTAVATLLAVPTLLAVLML